MISSRGGRDQGPRTRHGRARRRRSGGDDAYRDQPDLSVHRRRFRLGQPSRRSRRGAESGGLRSDFALRASSARSRDGSTKRSTRHARPSRSPPRPALEWAWGNVLLAAGRNEEALDALRGAISLQAGYGTALERMELALVRLGRLEEAIDFRIAQLRATRTSGAGGTPAGRGGQPRSGCGSPARSAA